MSLPASLANDHIHVLARRLSSVRRLHEHEAEAPCRRLTVRRSVQRGDDLVSDASRMWPSNMRRRRAEERLAHLLCEQFVRLECVGLAERGKPLGLPVTQADLADAAGMSAVHLNRTLQQLRNMNLVGRTAALEIRDWQGLCEVADFDPAYLHLDGPAAELKQQPPWRIQRVTGRSKNQRQSPAFQVRLSGSPGRMPPLSALAGENAHSPRDSAAAGRG
jgi:hypothetical protein